MRFPTLPTSGETFVGVVPGQRLKVVATESFNGGEFNVVSARPTHPAVGRLSVTAAEPININQNRGMIPSKLFVCSL
jgi:hypothetical protein